MRRAYPNIFAILLTVAAFAAARPAYAQIRQTTVRFDHLGIQDGLPDARITAIHQDPDGYIWIGTEDGLARYDGFEFQVFRYDPDDPNSLYDTTVYELAPSAAGGMWISAFTVVQYHDPLTGSFSVFTDSTGTTVPYDSYREVLEDSEGRVWAGSSENGVFRFDPHARSIHAYPVDPDDDHAIATPGVFEQYEARDGTLWIATGDYGLHRYRPETDDFERIRLRGPGTTEYEGYSHITEDPDGVLWMGGWGVTRYDPSTGESAVYLPDPSVPDPAPPDDRNYVNSLAWSADGRIWVGTNEHGLYRFDPDTETFTHHPHLDEDPASVISNRITDMLVDRTGVLWVGTEGAGISILDPRRERVARLSFSGMRGPGRVREDARGRLWIGSINELVRWDPGTETALTLKHGAGQEGFMEAEVSAFDFLPSMPGVLWIGAQDGHIRRMDAPGRISATFQIVDDVEPGDQGNPIWKMLETSIDPGTMWVSSWRTDLCSLDIDTGTRTCHEASDSIGPEQPRGFAEDILEPGVLWVASDNGLHRFDTRMEKYTNTWVHEPADTTSLSIDFTQEVLVSRHEPGILWVSTWSGGVNRFESRTGRVLRRYTEQNSRLPHNTTFDIVEDEHGSVWVGTARGVARIDALTGVLRDYTNVLGLSRSDTGVFSADHGDIVVTQDDGVVYRFAPGDFEPDETPPSVRLTGFLIRDEVVQPGPDSPLEEPISRAETVTLAYEQRDVSFDYTALEFLQPESVRFAYRIEGYEEEWHNAGNTRRATYTNLPPGEYRFRVRAANADGAWNLEGASIRIVIRPPWWRSIWAYVVYGLFLIGGVFAADRIQRRRLVRREREKAREKELEQARELEQAHRELETAHADLARSHEHLKATQAQLVEQEKLASLGSLTAGIAHEIKNPLNFVNNFAEVSGELAAELRDAVAAGDAEAANAIIADLLQNTDQIAKHGRRADSIVRSMMQHARGGTAEKETVDVNEFVGEYIDLAWHGMRARNDGFNADVDKDLDPAAGCMTVQSQEIGRVLVNLINNAFQVLASDDRPERGVVRVSTRRTGTGVEIVVSDNGPGIPEEIRSRIFEPFFTTKPTGEGTGLGLSLSYDIVTKGHGGEMIVDDAPGGGARFTVRLPDEPTNRDLS